LIQKAGGGGRRSGGPGRALQRSAHLATGDCDSPAPAASCSGVSSQLTCFFLLLAQVYPAQKSQFLFGFGTTLSRKKLKVIFFGGQKRKLTANAAKLVSFAGAVVRRALSASAMLCAPLQSHGGPG
jgi:hypothetical protein